MGISLKHQRILLIFDHPLALRSYIETSLIDELKLHLEVRIIFIGNSRGISNEIIDLNISSFHSFVLSLYANIYWNQIAYRARSIQNRTWYSRNNLNSKFSASIIALIYNKYISVSPIKLCKFFLFKFFKLLYSKINDLEITKIIYITVGGNNTISDFLYDRYHQKFDVITILENWDNMSSKAVFAFPPRKIGVWGDQSVNFAENIHNINRKYVRPIGNPRINWLLDNVKSNHSKTSIFFGGGSVDLDTEIEYLIATIEIAKTFKLKINYLPHPKNYKKMQEIISKRNLSEVNFIGSHYLPNSNDQILLPKLIDYLEPYQSAKIFVSSLSTMNLEAALLKIPSVAIDLSTNLSVLPNKISDRHDHISEAKQMGIFNFVSSINEYDKLLRNLLESNGIENPMCNSKSDLNYFVKTDKTFINNFLNLINS